MNVFVSFFLIFRILFFWLNSIKNRRGKIPWEKGASNQNTKFLHLSSFRRKCSTFGVLNNGFPFFVPRSNWCCCCCLTKCHFPDVITIRSGEFLCSPCFVYVIWGLLLLRFFQRIIHKFYRFLFGCFFFSFYHRFRYIFVRSVFGVRYFQAFWLELRRHRKWLVNMVQIGW